MNINTKWYFQSHPWPLWVIDMNKKVVFINDLCEEFFNIKFKDIEGKTSEEIFSSKVGNDYNREIDKCIENLKSKDFIRKCNDKIIKCSMFPILDDNNKPQEIVAIMVDITEQFEKEKEIRNGKQILRTIIDSLPEAIFYKDKDCRFIGYNKNFCDFYKDMGINDILGKNDLEIYPDKKLAQKFVADDLEIMKTKKAKCIVTSKVDGNGNKSFEESLKVPVIGENGKAWGVVGLARNVTTQKVLEEKLRYLSYTDTLTGVYNRTYFEEKLEMLNREECLPLGIIMGDVNGLKIINDSLGHLEGDNLLKNIANVLKEVCEHRGYVFRWGGDEFIILLPNCNEDECEEITNEIRKKCREKRVAYFELSIALGVTTKNEVDEKSYKLIKEVEERVYRQKLLEKNSMRSSIMDSLVSSLEAKNMETEEHTERVEKYALEIGRKLSLNSSDMDELILAARLHDIGKIGVDEEILLKKGELTEREYDQMKTHAEKGYRIINATSELGNVAKSVLTHHERWDGKGYPLGISKEEIPLVARIIAVADSYDVMTNARAYGDILTKEEAMGELKNCAGTQFDPKIINIFLNFLSEYNK